MPKVSSTILDRPRRNIRLPSRYRHHDTPEPFTAPPAIPPRAAEYRRRSPAVSAPVAGRVERNNGGGSSNEPTSDRKLEGRNANPLAVADLRTLSLRTGEAAVGRDSGPLNTVQAFQSALRTSRLADRLRRPLEDEVGRNDRIKRRHRQLLEEKDANIDELKGRIQRLERSERLLKAQLVEGRDNFTNKDAELGEVMRALQIAEETLDEKEETMRGLIREVHHYQGWWLNEYYCLKVALKLARNQSDRGVKAMREASQARFMTWSGSDQS